MDYEEIVSGDACSSQPNKMKSVALFPKEEIIKLIKKCKSIYELNRVLSYACEAYIPYLRLHALNQCHLMNMKITSAGDEYKFNESLYCCSTCRYILFIDETNNKILLLSRFLLDKTYVMDVPYIHRLGEDAKPKSLDRVKIKVGLQKRIHACMFCCTCSYCNRNKCAQYLEIRSESVGKYNHHKTCLKLNEVTKIWEAVDMGTTSSGDDPLCPITMDTICMVGCKFDKCKLINDEEYNEILNKKTSGVACVSQVLGFGDFEHIKSYDENLDIQYYNNQEIKK